MKDTSQAKPDRDRGIYQAAWLHYEQGHPRPRQSWHFLVN